MGKGFRSFKVLPQRPVDLPVTSHNVYYVNTSKVASSWLEAYSLWSRPQAHYQFLGPMRIRRWRSPTSASLKLSAHLIDINSRITFVAKLRQRGVDRNAGPVQSSQRSMFWQSIGQRERQDFGKLVTFFGTKFLGRNMQRC